MGNLSDWDKFRISINRVADLEPLGCDSEVNDLVGGKHKNSLICDHKAIIISLSRNDNMCFAHFCVLDHPFVFWGGRTTL